MSNPASEQLLGLGNSQQFGVLGDVAVLHNPIGRFANDQTAFANDRREGKFAIRGRGCRKADAALHHRAVDYRLIGAVGGRHTRSSKSFLYSRQYPFRIQHYSCGAAL